MKNVVRTVIANGTHGLLIDVECQLTNSLPSVVIVGFANKAVDEAKERIRSAFAATDIPLPAQRIVVNLAPADIPKEGTSFDLAIAAAIFTALAKTKISLSRTAFIGELGLDGKIRPIRGIIGKLIAGKRHGINRFFIPQANLDQASIVPGITLLPVDSLQQLQRHLAGTNDVQAIETDKIDPLRTIVLGQKSSQLDEIVGQPLGKRAIEISAAGGHNILLGGPPGTGKSMLAGALPGLLPPMSREEILEVTHLHSLASNNFSTLITDRPFRSPHHSASHVAIIGGGNTVRPGEMSLSHRGVLLFDEFPEFNRLTVEALRQPLENRTVSISRAKESVDYPANFIFVATANPCPCGYYRTKKPCKCMPHQILQYRRKLSGPILDRIDVYVDVHEIDNSQLLNDRKMSQIDSYRKRIAKARELQATRFRDNTTLNATMTNSQVKNFARLTPEARSLIDTGADKFGLSPRAYMRTVKVARTIADLDSSDDIRTQHVAEALQYRPHALNDL